MQEELAIAIIAGLGGMLGWGFADFFAKKTVDRVGPIVSLVWAHLFGTLALSILASSKHVALQPLSVPTDLPIWAGLLLFGALQAVVYLLAYRAFSKGQLAVLNPIFASYSGLAAVWSVVIFGEAMRGHLLLPLAVIFVGILVMNLDVEAFASGRINIIRAPGLIEMALAAILASFWTVLWDQFVGSKDWIAYAFLMYAFMTLTAFFVSLVGRVSLRGVDPAVWKFLVLIGVCEVIAYLAISLGFSSTSLTSVVALLSGSFSLPTMVLARVFLKEQVTAAQTIGGLAIVGGIVVLYVL